MYRRPLLEGPEPGSSSADAEEEDLSIVKSTQQNIEDHKLPEGGMLIIIGARNTLFWLICSLILIS